MSLKNIAMGSPIIDPGYFRNVANCSADKASMHGSGNQDLNDNLHILAGLMAPDLAVIDGFEGMEGNGPCWGTKVTQNVAVVSLDWFAADRAGVELMGVKSTDVAYRFCPKKRWWLPSVKTTPSASGAHLTVCCSTFWRDTQIKPA